MVGPAVRLPTDMPPGPRQGAGGATRMVQGLVTHASLGEVAYPLYTAPWSPRQSTVFPLEAPSAVAPNSLRPTWVVAINGYSPVAHRNPLVDVTPPKAITAAGVARPTQRPRGYALPYVTRWPQLAPRWPSWGEAPGARRG